MKPNAKIQTPRHHPILIAAFAGLIPSVLVIWGLGLPINWPTLLLPLSVSGFATFWTWLLARRMRDLRALIGGIALGLILAHAIMWLPFITLSYAEALGAANLIRAISSGIATSAILGWYLLGQYLLPTLLVGLALLVLLRVSRLTGTHSTDHSK